VTASLNFARTAECRRPGTALQASHCFPMVDPAAAAGTLRVCDQLVRFVVAPQTFFTGERCGELNSRRLPNAPAVELFRDLTNVETVLGRRPAPAPPAGPARTPEMDELFRSQQYRLDAWAAVLDSLNVGRNAAGRLRSELRFTGVAPERANLALNTAHDLRQDWVNMLLGGAQARWTNFELAEALSRLVAGRQVRGRLVASVDRTRRSLSDPQLAAAPLFDSTLRSGVRRRVLYGMSLVIENGAGTAQRLRPGIARLSREVAAMGYELQAFAKTGTPTVEVAFSTRQDELVQRIVRRGISFNAADSTFSWSAQGETARDSAWFAANILAPMRSEPGEYRAVNGVGPLGHPLYLEGALVRHQGMPTGRLARQGGVLILGLLAVPANLVARPEPGDQEWFSACPSEELRAGVLGVPGAASLLPSQAVALSVAAWVDDLPLGQGSSRAVSLVNTTLDALGSHLKRQIARKKAARLP
jgi:hypothetical protein